MTENNDAYFASDFPREERFRDFSGRIRTFQMRLVETEVGVGIVADEITESEDAYEFTECGSTIPEALAAVRLKIATVVSVRNLSTEGGTLSLLHDESMDGSSMADC